jgi:hypothetical protein
MTLRLGSKWRAHGFVEEGPVINKASLRTNGRQFPVYRAFREGRLLLISAARSGAFRTGCVSDAAGF